MILNAFFFVMCRILHRTGIINCSIFQKRKKN